MTNTQRPNRLQKQLASMIALEAVIEQKLGELIPTVSTYSEAEKLLKDFQALTKTQRKVLETRLQTLGGVVPASKGTAGVTPVEMLSQEADYPVSTALQIIYTLLSQAVIGYSVLHPLSTRFLDSPYIADEGTSYHLTRQHTQNYVQAIQQISRLFHDVVLWELDQKGLECQCTCPSCAAGICLCALAGRMFLRDTWVEAGPISADEGVYVLLPKQNSAAAKAGLRRGDVILAAGGQDIGSFVDLQNVVKNAKSGEEIRLKVRRDSDVVENVSVVRP